MEISYAVIADYANISREGKPNIMGIFDRIWAETFPCNHGQMFLVTSILAELLDAKIKDWEIKVVLYDENSEEILTIGGIFNFRNSPEGELGTANSILILNNLPFKEPGTYKFSIFIDNVLKKEIRLKLSKLVAKE